jgi:hypothetical protein
MSETTIAALAITVGLIAQIVLQVMAKMDANKAAALQEKNSQRIEATAHQIAVVADVTQDVHTLVNSNMGVQLKLNADLSRWKANQMKGGPGAQEAERAAIEAEIIYQNHVAKQHLVDTKG